MVAKEDVFSIENDDDFNRIALKIFQYQIENNEVYKKYVNNLHIDKSTVQHYTDIPFLPIQFFKTQKVSTIQNKPLITFTSSGTTGMINSQHHVYDLDWYELSFRKAFEQFYGKAENVAILALLPSYLERDGSSLIYMIDDLIKSSNLPQSNYFLYNHEELYHILNQLKSQGTKTLLIGVTYALLDFVENYKIDFPELIVMETGGMKGKRKEMIREELHQVLNEGFGVMSIHSEYGMTELLSQGYSNGYGLFKTPKWMKILIRDTNDPLTLITNNNTGAINVIDLANVHSCSFIATQDLGRKYEDDGSFEVLGRFDNADIRGCNLLVQ
ncbi:LuxE/PaaK family acyltransferase [Sphingobacterium bovistauri]|uniref:Acyl transferase n=1 Tax=Sphingobacterium bovistauri TaxID=2781959 RepID=A0ABS7Z3I6_9SPHI|nr:acyl transferase [Sphingobacterium bovistauri]MCA5003534.1 acyl transferase [Sphingobacterium bovistauri]